MGASQFDSSQNIIKMPYENGWNIHPEISNGTNSMGFNPPPHIKVGLNDRQ
jgi:hypothetical protein